MMEDKRYKMIKRDKKLRICNFKINIEGDRMSGEKKKWENLSKEFMILLKERV